MSFWRRFFSQPAPSPAPVAAVEPMQAAMRTYVAREIAAGYQSEEEIVATAMDYLSDDYDEALLRQWAPQITRQALHAHLQAQKAWPAETDYDRLHAAFTEANRVGIVAQENFTCCQSCGHAEIGEALDQAEQQGVKVRGYVFFHQQDTEHAVKGDGLYLAYGSLESASTAIAREMTDILDRHHIVTVWDGTAGQRIFVKLDWKRRWPFTE